MSGGDQSEPRIRVASAGVGRVRDSGFSRGRLSGVSVCADRLRSRRVRCPDSLCHSWHTKNTRVTVLVFTRGAVPRADITPCEFRPRK